jgi:hypothetical protein
MFQKKYALTTLLATAFVYFLLDAFNRLLFASSTSLQGESWVYLPAGLRLAFILIFLGPGALGIVFASCAIGLLHYSGMDATTVLGAGLISGLSPCIARRICLDKFKISSQLHQLSSGAVLKMAVVFAALNAVLQQMWLTWRDQAPHFAEAAAQMFVSDLLGTFIVLYVAKCALSLLPIPRPLK